MEKVRVKGKLVGKVLAAFEGLIWNQAEKDGNVEIVLPPVNVADLKEGMEVLVRCRLEFSNIYTGIMPSVYQENIVAILPQEEKKLRKSIDWEALKLTKDPIAIEDNHFRALEILFFREKFNQLVDIVKSIAERAEVK